MNGDVAEGWIDQIAARALQALAADPDSHRFFVMLKQAMQVAGGDVVRGGDGAQCQLWVVQVRLDKGIAPGTPEDRDEA